MSVPGGTGPRLARRAPRHIPEEKFNELFAALGSHRDRALVAFWVYTGARASELLGVSCRDADPGQQLIAVIRKGTRHLQRLPASPDAFVWLRLYQAQLQGLVPAGPDDSLWWTLRRPFRQLTYHAAYRMFHRASASPGANWSLHDLRHLAAYRMTRDPGMPLADVQWVLGHAQLATTQLYISAPCSTALRILMAGAGKRRWGCRCGCSGRAADRLLVGGGALPTGRGVAGLHPGAGAGTVGGVGCGAALPVVFLAKPSGRTAGLTLGGVVLTVNGDGALVERQLAGGELGCPLCGGALGGWGHARPRPVRMAEGPDVVLVPRRSRCPGCGATHVLLPAWCLSRRADEGAVIGSALQAAAAGAGHRTIAAGLGRPASTVRGWLRRFAARAEAVRAFFTVLLARTSPDPVMPAGAAGPVAAAVLAIAGAAAAVAQRWPRVGSVPVWTAASAASGGLLIAPGWPGAGRYTS